MPTPTPSPEIGSLLSPTSTTPVNSSYAPTALPTTRSKRPGHETRSASLPRHRRNPQWSAINQAGGMVLATRRQSGPHSPRLSLPPLPLRWLTPTSSPPLLPPSKQDLAGNAADQGILCLTAPSRVSDVGLTSPPATSYETTTHTAKLLAFCGRG